MLISPSSNKATSSKVYKFGDQSYATIEKLGKGTYGSVVKAINPLTNQKVAIKKIKLDVDSEGIPSTTLREIAILKATKHPNIVKLHDLSIHDKKILLCMEFVEYDLKKFMDVYSHQKIINADVIKHIMHQILTATDYLHGMKLLHRDLKPQNVLVDKELKVRLADFGLSRWFNIPIKAYTKEVLTLWYRAPELIYGSEFYSTGIDMWSIGCIFAELFLSVPIFKGNSEIDQLFKIGEILGSPTEESFPGLSTFPNYNDKLPKWQTKNGLENRLEGTGICPDGLDLLGKLLLFNPSKRITAKAALKHAYFKGSSVVKSKKK